MTLFGKILEIVGRITKTIIIVPHPITVGNTAEDIYFGLLKARAEGKKLALLFPFQLPGKLTLKMTNRELIELESPYFAFPRKSWQAILGSCIVTTYFGMNRALSLGLNKMARLFSSQRYRGLVLPECHTIPMIGQELLWRPSSDIKMFSWKIVNSYGWINQLSEKIDVHISDGKAIECYEKRRALGLPDDAWYVCLHIREAGYHNDPISGAPRNANIINYLPAIEEIVFRGGWVVRLGDQSMTRLPAMSNVIDYPFTPEKSELMDIFLISTCKLFIGMHSGVYDIAVLFQRPIILTNMPGWLFGYPPKDGDLGVFKHVYCKRRRRILTPEEWLSEPFAAASPNPSTDYDFIENSSDELVAVVKAYFEKPRTLTARQTNFKKLRIKRGIEILSEPIVANDIRSDIHLRYRFASRLESATGAILFQESRVTCPRRA